MNSLKKVGLLSAAVGIGVWFYQVSLLSEDVVGETQRSEPAPKEFGIELASKMEMQRSSDDAELGGLGISKEEVRLFHEIVFPDHEAGPAVDVSFADPIHVYDYFGGGSDVVIYPVMELGVVRSLVVYRKGEGGSFRPARIEKDYVEGWTQYPPIGVHEAARAVFAADRRGLAWSGRLVHLDGITPMYEFIADETDDVRYLVNSIHGEVVQAPNPAHLSEKDGQEEVPVFVTDEGLVVIDDGRVGNLTEDELARLRQEVEDTNTAIRAGKLKIGKDLAVVFDHREADPN